MKMIYNNEVTQPTHQSSNKSHNAGNDYKKTFKIDELFPVYSTGIETDGDKNLISFSKLSQFSIKYHYRIFDDRFIDYDRVKIITQRSVMKNLIADTNIALITTKQTGVFNFRNVFLSQLPVDADFFSPEVEELSYFFPLYLYTEIKNQQSTGEIKTRTPNLNPKIVNQIATQLSLSFTNEKEIPSEGEVCFVNSPEVRPEFRLTFAPIDILDYIYAVLHSTSYRKKYKGFLKTDFPGVLYPKDTTTFWKLVALGGKLRQIHLLECSVVEKYITKYPVDGNNMVAKIKYQDNKVFINETQYFDYVPQIAWEFYIGGYQPAQKWLKDRKGSELNFEDISHYQKIIVALTETDLIIKEIDKIKID